MEKSEIKSVINDLIRKNLDAQKGYQKAADQADDAQLKSFFRKQSTQRADFAGRLREEASKHVSADDLDTEGSAKGSMHRTWMDIKAALSSDDDEAMLEECLRGDKASLEEYEDVLSDHDQLPENLRQTITSQLINLKGTLNEVEHLEDLH
ncbi:ferritin-like domain-containing protein [Robertkochia aurantiaca]|uniref:ferritin-like domain-containing protein n=1 Tax=Robertkochia aurantiaca TaxID=2873700 RepID=UPI001CCB5717|nr:PA2169 family four-helix-bundle protein [Robertkochia sp. 3YJGBD-33]